MAAIGSKCEVATFANSLCSQGGRPAKCFTVSGAHFPSDPSVLHLGMCLLEEASGCVSHGCEFSVTPTGGGETGSPPPQVWRLHQRRLRVLRRKRDCTLPLPHILEVAFYLVSVDFGGGRIGTSPFLLTLPVGTSEEEGQALLLTTSASASEEEGQAFLLTPSVCTSCVWSRVTMG